MPIQPSYVDDVVYYTIVERVGGSGSVNVTHLVAFQEFAPRNILKTSDSSVPHRNSKILFYEDKNVDKPVSKITEPGEVLGEICNFFMVIFAKSK